jgi:hypothetical protein
MPNPRAFLDAFNLFKGSLLADDIKIEKVSIKHIVEEKYKYYTFPLVLTIISSQSATHVKSTVSEILKTHKVVLSQYGNPYDCYITDFKIESKGIQMRIGEPKPITKTYQLTCIGHGKRIMKK